MAAKSTVLTLETLAEGAAGELFERALEQVFRNIRDPNTDAKATRKIVLEVAIKPKADRESFEYGVNVKTTVAPMKPVHHSAYLGQTQDGRLVAAYIDPRQLDAFEARDPDIHPLRREVAND